MGMNKYTHIGPYLLVPNLRKLVTRVVRVDNMGNEMEEGFKFDPVTGKAYDTVTITENKINRPCVWGDDEHYEKFEALGLDEDTFACVTSFHPERYEIKTHSIFLVGEDAFKDDDEPTSMIGLDVNSELEKFKVKFKKYIDFFEECYGPVIVVYGVVPYWN